MSEYTDSSDQLSSLNNVKLDIKETNEAPAENAWVYWGMVLLGAGVLFPYNTIMAASDYYDNTWPGKDVEFYAPLVISIASPFMQLAMVQLQALFSYSSRINVSFLFSAVAIILLPIAVLLFSTDASFYIALILILSIGFIQAILQNTLFAFSAMFPAIYTQALMAGNGWSGVIVSGMRCILKYAFPDTKKGYTDGAFIYFGFASMVTLACIATYISMRKSAFIIHYFVDSVKESSEADMSTALLSPNSAAVVNSSAVAADVEAATEEDSVDNWAVFGKIKFMALHVCMVFVMTFIVFPGLLVSITPSFDLHDGWFGTLMILQFNVFDLMGRSLPQYWIGFNKDNVYLGVYARFLLYPLFVLCAHSDVFPNSWWVVFFNAIFSITNGYFSSLTMMFAPDLVEDKEKSTAGGFMSMALVTGILAGSTINLAIKKIFW